MLTGYPRSFYSDIITKLNGKLKEYYEEHTNDKYSRESFHDYATGILNDSLSGKSGERELRYYANERQKYHKRKKKRWVDYLIRDVNQLKCEEKAHPFHNLYKQKEILTKAQWKVLYGTDSLDAIIKKEIEKAQIWLDSPDTLLIEFPAIESMTEKRKSGALEDDIVKSMLDVLDNEYAFRIDNIVRPYVDDMTSGSIFADTRMSYTQPEDGGNFEKELFRSEDGFEKLIITIDKSAFVNGRGIQHLDVKDQETLFYLIKKVETENIDPGSTFVVDVGEFARNIAPTKASGKHYLAARERFFRLSNITYQKFRDGKQIAGIHFLDATEVPGNQNMLNITLGPAISTPLIDNKIRHFSGQEYDKLELNLSRILFLHLQRERLKAYKKYTMQETTDCSTVFSYSNFQAMAYLHGGKRKNWINIKESLAEMKARGIMIKGYEVDNISYTVKILFFPLSQEEIRDAKWYGLDESLFLPESEITEK